MEQKEKLKGQELEKRIYEIKDSYSKFKDKPFREYQLEAIKRAYNSDKRIIVIEAPTGSGKTLIGVILGVLSGNFSYVVQTKALQNQVSRDFPDIMEFMGKNNYQCNRYPGETAEFCTKPIRKDCKYLENGECYYHYCKERASFSRGVILNYAYTLIDLNLSEYNARYKSLAARDILICDEADMIDNSLQQWFDVTFSKRSVRELDIELPDYLTSASGNGVIAWKNWMRDVVRKKVVHNLNHYTSMVEGIRDYRSDENKTIYKKYLEYTRLYNKLTDFFEIVDDEWLLEYKQGMMELSFTFKPTWIRDIIAYPKLWKHCKKFVLMSATFPPPEIMANTIGVDVDDIEYFNIPSMFPTENKVIRLCPVANITNKTFDDEVGKLCKAIKQILETHEGQKGIIHAVSYRLCETILRCVKSPRILVHNATNKKEVFEEFTTSRIPYVLVSPSMERGIDLPDELCEFIVVAKCPYESLGDKQTSSRVHGYGRMGNRWYKSMAAQSIVQGCGRGVRHKDDKCVCYLLDQQIANLIEKNPSLFPSHFIDSLVFKAL